MLSVDECIDKLLACRNALPGTEVNLPEESIIRIVRTARDIFLQQPMLLEIAGLTLSVHNNDNNNRNLFIFLMILFYSSCKYLW